MPVRPKVHTVQSSYLTLEFLVLLKALTRPTPRCYYIADFSTTTTDRLVCALSLAPSRAPSGASESAPEAAAHPAPRADPPGASGQRSKRGGEHRLERNPSRLPAGVEGTSILARNGRGRCGERPHARNGRSRATRRAAAASGACRYESPAQPGSTLAGTTGVLADSERARPPRSFPDPASTERSEARSGGRGMPSGRGLSSLVSVELMFGSANRRRGTRPLLTNNH